MAEDRQIGCPLQAAAPKGCAAAERARQTLATSSGALQQAVGQAGRARGPRARARKSAILGGCSGTRRHGGSRWARAEAGARSSCAGSRCSAAGSRQRRGQRAISSNPGNRGALCMLCSCPSIQTSQNRALPEPPAGLPPSVKVQMAPAPACTLAAPATTGSCAWFNPGTSPGCTAVPRHAVHNTTRVDDLAVHNTTRVDGPRL